MNGKRDALRLVKDDYKLLSDKIKIIVPNLNVPGSLSMELHELLLAAEAEIILLDTPTDLDLRKGVSDLVTLALGYIRILENSLVPGDMVEEVYSLLVACKYLEDRWIKNPKSLT